MAQPQDDVAELLRSLDLSKLLKLWKEAGKGARDEDGSALLSLVLRLDKKSLPGQNVIKAQIALIEALAGAGGDLNARRESLYSYLKRELSLWREADRAEAEARAHPQPLRRGG